MPNIKLWACNIHGKCVHHLPFILYGALPLLSIKVIFLGIVMAGAVTMPSSDAFKVFATL